MHECLFYKAHASFLPPCEFTRFMHFFFFHHRANLSNSCTLFFTAVRTYQTHALFSSPPCELIRLMHSSFHHRANLSGSCTLLLFFTTVRTYQTHTLFFRLLAFRPLSYTCKNIVVLRTLWKEPGDVATTKTMWYRNLAWSTRLGKISNQINLYYSSICTA